MAEVEEDLIADKKPQSDGEAAPVDEASAKARSRQLKNASLTPSRASESLPRTRS